MLSVHTPLFPSRPLIDQTRRWRTALRELPLFALEMSECSLDHLSVLPTLP